MEAVMAICGDIHFGAKTNDEKFLEYQNRCFDYMIDYCVSNGIRTISFLGDVFNNRSSISIFILDYVIKKFTEISDKFDNIIITIGNHDTFYKNTNKLNSPDIIFNSLFSDKLKQKIKIIYDDPEEVTINGSLVLLVPWITKDNYEKCITAIENSTSKYCLGHFEINGFLMNSFVKCDGGLKTSSFKNFDRVLSGHFHTKSENKNIKYVGSLTQLTWNDYSDPRGFHILEQKTGKLDFIQCANEIFIKIIINETTDLNQFSNVKDSYIKVYINRKLNNKEEKVLTNILMQNIRYEVIDNTLVDDITDMEVNDESTDVIIKEGIDIQENMSDNEKRDVYKTIMNIYNKILVEGA